MGGKKKKHTSMWKSVSPFQYTPQSFCIYPWKKGDGGFALQFGLSTGALRTPEGSEDQSRRRWRETTGKVQGEKDKGLGSAKLIWNFWKDFCFG